MLGPQACRWHAPGRLDCDGEGGHGQRCVPPDLHCNCCGMLTPLRTGTQHLPGSSNRGWIREVLEWPCTLGGGGYPPNYWAPLTRKRHTPPHPAQPQHTNHWAPRTRKRHQQEHRPQRPTQSSNPTQHAKGRTGDRPGPGKEATTRRNVTQGVTPPSQTKGAVVGKNLPLGKSGRAIFGAHTFGSRTPPPSPPPPCNTSLE